MNTANSKPHATLLNTLKYGHRQPQNTNEKKIKRLVTQSLYCVWICFIAHPLYWKSNLHVAGTSQHQILCVLVFDLGPYNLQLQGLNSQARIQVFSSNLCT